jgi:hypothetical protein
MAFVPEGTRSKKIGKMYSPRASFTIPKQNTTDFEEKLYEYTVAFIHFTHQLNANQKKER